MLLGMTNKTHSILLPDGLNQIKVLEKLRKERDRELLYFFKGKRQIARFEGEANCVNPGNNSLLMKDCAVMHNHLQGSSFSVEDVAIGITFDAVELWVISGQHTFLMKRPSRGWGIKPLNNQGDYTDEFLALRNEALELAHEAVDRMVLAHTIEQRERDKYINHIL
jgi:hypothetical protein